MSQRKIDIYIETFKLRFIYITFRLNGFIFSILKDN